jgi:phosphodiesterase/alkaline phosphatase D-like protein
MSFTGAGAERRPRQATVAAVASLLLALVAIAIVALPSPSAPTAAPTVSRADSRPGSPGRAGLGLRLPSGLAAAASARIGGSDRGFWPVRHGSAFRAQGGALRSTFTASGVEVRAAEGSVAMSLAGVGRGRRLETVPAAAPVGAGNEVRYTHGALTEYYRNGPYGLEQGFVVRHRVAGSGPPLVLALHLAGSLRAAQAGSQVVLRRAGGRPALDYGALSASDATGRPLGAHLRLTGGTLRLEIDDSSARYPIRIDPFVQQGSEITGLGPGCGYHLAALSGDGSTALLGNLCTNKRTGAAWVFVRSGASWTQQAQLIPTDRVGAAEFGEDVALSHDGSTALVGGENDNAGHGAAWVFTRSGSTWGQQGPKLAGGTGEHCGVSVGLSSDGNTALMACHGSPGGVYFFSRSGSSWTQQGPRVAVAPGIAAAISGDGNTALVTGTGATPLVRSGSTWAQQGSSLSVPASGRGGAALSADGNTGLAGGTAIVRSGSTWTKQQQLSSSHEGEALSADGNTALIGAAGGPTVFVRTGSSWSQRERLTGEAAAFVGLSDSAATALVGDETGWRVFVARPAAPAVVTEPASAVTQTTATLNASVDPEAETVSDCHFEYGPTASYGSTVPCSSLPGGGEGAVEVSASISGLAPNTPYHFRIVATNPTGTSEGADRTFTTLPSAPAAVTEPASEVTASSAVLNATVNPTGANVSQCTFEYGPTASYGSSVPCSALPGSGNSPVAVSAGVTGLAANSTYHFRIVAVNAGGTGTGEDGTLTTGTAAPSVVTEAASAVTQASATLNASVNPNGETVSDCHFEYGPTASYGTSVPCSLLPGGGSSPVAVSASISGLAANTSYHFRIVATNATGTSEGADETLTSLPPPAAVVTEAASEVTSSGAVLNATVNPEGANVSDCRFEYGPTASYGASVPCSSAPGSGESPVAVSATIGGLAASSTYHFRIVATNAGGSAAGEDESLTTLSSAPSAVTGAATSVTRTSATLNGSVNPNGTEVTDCHFEYGTSPSYGASAPCSQAPGSGRSAVAVSAGISGLSGGTTYHFRVVATNSAGTGFGGDQPFSTANAPEFGRCLKVAAGTGKYENGGCTKTGATKLYEWFPEVVKAHFTTKIATSTSVTLETVKAAKVTCTGQTGAGEYTGSKTIGGLTLSFTGCERLGEKCSSAGASAGEVLTSPLAGQLGVTFVGETRLTDRIGLDLLPAAGPGTFMEFTCGTAVVTVRGSVIVPVSANVMKPTAVLAFAQTKGKQKPERFVGEAKDVLEASFNGGPFEQAGLALKTNQTNEEKVEVNSVV